MVLKVDAEGSYRKDLICKIDNLRQSLQGLRSDLLKGVATDRVHDPRRT